MKHNITFTPPRKGKLTDWRDAKAIFPFFIYSFVLLLFLSPDSYLYDLYYHIDSACFFMCGKAWMCGMVPYVDFADSKGPLLWLIYGIGYLISHHSYIGVFWLSVLFYTMTLFAAYKLCCLFLDKSKSAISIALLPLFLFNPFFHIFEIRGEDFCCSFIMISLYCTCRILKNRDSNAQIYLKMSGLMGFCSMCCMLIKYNIGCMFMGLMAVVLYMAIKHKAGWKCFCGMAIGFVVPAIPFIICFLIYGNMSSFIQEYFLNTFQTIQNSTTKGWFFQSGSLIRKLMVGFSTFGMLLILLIGIILFSKKHKLGYWLVPCFFIFILGLGKVVHSVHYYLITIPFSVFFVMEMMDFFIQKLSYNSSKIKAICVFFALLSLSFNAFFYSYRQIKSDEEELVRRNYYTAAYVMAQVERPKIFYIGGWSIGVPADILPACRYWIGQTGATDEMISERKRNLKDGVADFVCVYSNKKEIIKEIENYGYVLYCYAPPYGGRETDANAISVYGRPGLTLPSENFHVSQWDVWLKRNIFGI